MDRQTTTKVDIEAELARLQALIAEQRTQIEEQRAQLDSLTAQIVAEGLATLSARPRTGSDAAGDKILIVRGASNLLEDIEAQSDLQRVRTLFDDIERKNDLIGLLELARKGEGASPGQETLL